jgi:hypothetical protein
MAGTCQILQREDYLGVLEPWRDYIPLESDFSNMDEVIRVMNDLDQCDQIVSDAKRSLLDSKMFDYSVLVDTACNGLLSAPGDKCVKWNQFSKFLQFSHAAQASSVELHDATLHLISEVIIHKVSPKISESYVRQQIDDMKFSLWFETMAQLTKEDSMSMRSPWIWRSVINEESFNL